VRRAFTLVEVVVALAILALAGAMLYPSFAATRQQANDKTAIGLADQLAVNLLHYAALNGGTYPANYDNCWYGTILKMGSAAEFSSVPPAIFMANGADTSGCNLITWSDAAGSTFQIEFQATGGTSTLYCRDPNGIAQLSSWNSSPTSSMSGCP